MFRVTKLHPDARVPQRANLGDAGYDVTAVEEVVIPGGGGWAAVSTGLTFEFPADCYARIAPRSGLAVRYGLDVLAGVVDSSYRGDVRVVIVNHGSHPYRIQPGDRVAQLIFERIYTPELVLTTELTETTRGADGFGSTGRA